MRRRTSLWILFAMALLLLLSLPVSASAESPPAGDTADIWADLVPLREELPDGTVRFSLALNEEQAEQITHADLRILRQMYTERSGATEAYYQVWHTSRLEPDENGILSAVFPGNAIYVVDDVTGEVLAGPVDCVRMRDGRAYSNVIYSNDAEIGIFGDETFMARYYLEIPEEPGPVRVESIENLDTEQPVTTELDEEELAKTSYTRTIFWSLDLEPTEEESEVLGLPGWQWNDANYWSEIPQTGGWHFEVRKMEEGFDLLRAVFRVVDLEDRNHCTEALRVFPELVREYTGTWSAAAPELELEGSGAVRAEYFLEKDCVRVWLDLGVLPDGIESLNARQFRVNDTTVLRQLTAYSDSGVIAFSLNDRNTAGILEVDRIGFDLEMSNGTYGEERTVYVSIELPEPILLDREGIAPLAETTTDDGLVWRLWGIQQLSDSEVRVNYDVTNPAGKAKRLSHEDAVFGRLYGSTFGSVEIALGQTVVSDVTIETGVTAYHDDDGALMRNDRILAWLGDSEFQDLRLFYQDDAASYADRVLCQAAFHWEEPVTYTPAEHSAPEKNTILLSQEEQEIRLAEFQVRQGPELDTNCAVLGLWLENRGEKDVVLQFDSVTLNGARISNRNSETSIWEAPEPILVPAGAIRYSYFVIELPEGTDAVSRIEFDCFADGNYLGPVTAENR